MHYLKCPISNTILAWTLMMLLESSSSHCDTKHIRLTYLLACSAKKKRGGVNFYNEIEKGRKISRRFSAGNSFLNALTGVTEGFDEADNDELMFHEDTLKEARESLKMGDGGVALGGMMKEDSLYILSDLLDDDVVNNVISRREISELIDKCCKFTCSAIDFIKAC